MESEKGYSSVSVLIFILFLSTIVLGLMTFLQISQERNKRFEKRYSVEVILDSQVKDLIKILSDDPSPEADSFFDPVWAYIENQNSEDLSLKLEDLSSRFNLNFVRTKMLNESSFKGKMNSGFSPDDLKLFRGEEGFFSDKYIGFSEFYDEEILDKYFTVYGYANLNVTYEDSLKKIYQYNVSLEGSSSFLSLIQQLISRGVMADTEEMKKILGINYDSLYPLINVEPLMNVNFIPEEVLLAIVNYPYGGKKHKNSSAFYDVITAERSSFEFTPDKLNSLLQVKEDYLRIKEYLGTKTWFWKITATEGKSGLEVIIALLPNEKLDNLEKKYRVIQWKSLNG